MVEGIEKGKAEGKKNAFLAIAKQMLDQGLEVEKISQFTNLSEQEIHSIGLNGIQSK